MAGRALVLKVDTEKYPQLAAQFGVQGIPNFIVMKGGLLLYQQAGVVTQRPDEALARPGRRPGKLSRPRPPGPAAGPRAADLRHLDLTARAERR